jgi:cobalt-zinc-cadmium efflux system outer membrane protein
VPEVRDEAGAEGARAALGKKAVRDHGLSTPLAPALVATLAATFAAACASVSPERGHDQVAALIQERTGQKTRWQSGPPDDAQVAAWVRSAAAAGLTRARAVEIALVNSPELQMTYEDLGISQADMVQAGLLRNPTLGADFGFQISSGRTSELRVSLVQDFLDLFVLPLRKQIAREQFEADTLRVAHRALETAADVEKSFVTAQARAELVAFRRTVVEATGAAADLSQRQFDAGNVSELDHASERAAHEQAKLELAREEIELLDARERVSRLLGLWGETTTWRFAESLPQLPPAEPRLEHLEAFAMRQRLDVAVARRTAALLGKSVDMARSTRLLGRLEVGIDAHQDPDGPRVLGPNLVVELPIFDQRQAVIARLEAQRRQQERRLAATAVDARSEVRLADARLRAARLVASHQRDVVLPLRKRIAEQALLHYNGMFVGLYQLLAAKQGEVEALRGYLEALRDYWIAQAELRRALGGALPAAAEPAPLVAPTPAPTVTPTPEGTAPHAH